MQNILKMKLSTVLTFALTSFTSSFTSMSKNSSTAALKISELNNLGALPPVGLFNPLRFASKANNTTLMRHREAEFTHGRVAMLADAGFLVGEKVEGSLFLFEAKSVVQKLVTQGKYQQISDDLSFRN